MNESTVKGRGAVGNPANRFEPLHLERDPEWDPDEDPAPGTRFFRDNTETIIAYNDSPDVGFNASVNPYRGCEHGCIYCYARPTHEYLGFSAGLDFESRIMVKEQAPVLLRRELASPGWKPQTLAMSGVTDCYQPVERKLQLTRRCLEVLLEFRNPVGIVTKNHLVTRDIDLLRELTRFDAAAVFITITTLDAELAAKLEPRASLPRRRLAAMEALSAAGIPVGLMVAPVIPALTDHEMPEIISQAARSGARCAAFVPLRLPFGLGELFEGWLTRHFPNRKDKILNGIRAIRSGRMNDGEFGSRMRGEGIFADQMAQLFHASVRKAGLSNRGPELSTAAFWRPAGRQLVLFDPPVAVSTIPSDDPESSRAT